MIKFISPTPPSIGQPGRLNDAKRCITKFTYFVRNRPDHQGPDPIRISSLMQLLAARAH